MSTSTSTPIMLDHPHVSVLSTCQKAGCGEPAAHNVASCPLGVYVLGVFVPVTVGYRSTCAGHAVELGSKFVRWTQAPAARCDFCATTARHIDSKGYIYCDSHKIAGRGRKLTRAELATLAAGGQVARY